LAVRSRLEAICHALCIFWAGCPVGCCSTSRNGETGPSQPICLTDGPENCSLSSSLGVTYTDEDVRTRGYRERKQPISVDRVEAIEGMNLRRSEASEGFNRRQLREGIQCRRGCGSSRGTRGMKGMSGGAGCGSIDYERRWQRRGERIFQVIPALLELDGAGRCSACLSLLRVSPAGNSSSAA
jgi:hypothetical protein